VRSTLFVLNKGEEQICPQVKKWDKKLWGGDSELSRTLHLCTINPICFGKQQNSVKRNKLIKFKAGKGRSQNGVSTCCRRAFNKEELLLLVFFLSPGHFLKLHSHTLLLLVLNMPAVGE
jgi:hypothetical protein